MKIRQVEELVGISKKNIRFYEDQGLLRPGRSDNGYREYHEADIRRLKQIKLSLPIGEIRDVLSGSRDLAACLGRHLKTLDQQKHTLEETERLSRYLIDSHRSIDTLDVDACLEEMRRLEKGGTKLMDVRNTDVHKKKTRGALFGAILIIALMAFLVAVILWGNSADPLPTGLLILMLAFPVGLAALVIVALVQRIKEIKGGEEDEAAKY